MAAFADEEIVIPAGGPFEGRRFSSERQPYTRLLFSEIDSGRWTRIVATGPTQSGKSLSAFVIPCLYHLFEVQETVILGLPSLDMAGDKWQVDLLPVVAASRYRDLLPSKGPGSRGGRVEAIRFANGRFLRFMTGGGDDKSRAGYTSRVLIVTETDGMDRSSETSREADKITQLEARTRAHGSRKRIYMECTLSTTEGRTWREYQAGTASRIAIPCPHCRAYVSPGREDLRGWRDAANETEAKMQSAFHCPSCEVPWTEEERQRANARGVLVHRGQEITKEGKVTGDPPVTSTLGFRWSAVNNLFLTPGELAEGEWKAARSGDGDSAEKEQLQFVWALPHEPEALDVTKLEVHGLQRRTREIARGVIPELAKTLTIGFDVGMYLCHWVAVAWLDGATGYIIDYGRVEVATQELGVEKGVLLALRDFREAVVAKGWPVGAVGGQARLPDQVWVDAGYQTDSVYAFCRETPGQRWRPAVGRGHGQQRIQSYMRPKTTGNLVRFIGEGYHLTLLRKERLHLAEVNSDQWKSWVHQRLSVAPDTVGALALYQAQPHEHLAFTQHMVAERQVEEFVAGKGAVVRWEAVRRNNHWFDALYLAAAAGHFAGTRLIEDQRAEPIRRRSQRQPITTPDGQPFLATER